MLDASFISGNKRIIGFLRYSVISEPSLRGWRGTRGATFEDAQRRIFDDRRLAVRAQLFEALPLPCFRYLAANGPEFELCIVASTLLPRSWRERLTASVAGLGFVHILDVEPDEPINTRMHARAFNELPPGVQVVTSFRIDDDDCVFADYMNTLRRASTKGNAGKIHSFTTGYYSGVRADGTIYLRSMRKAANAWGIAYISREQERRTIFQLGNHNRIQERAEMISDNRPHAWIRSIHDAADTFGTAPEENPDQPWLVRPGIDAILSEHFPFLDPGAIENAYRSARDSSQ